MKMPNQIEPRRQRVLLMAFQCHPSRGSEYTVGWNRALGCAKYFDTCVLSYGNDNAEAVTQYLAAHPDVTGLRFEFLFVRPWQERLIRTPGVQWLMYNAWQRRALRAARRLHESLHFDLVHHSNDTAFREPGYLWKLGLPVVWGPLGGVDSLPWRFLGEAGLLHGIREGLRTIANEIQLRTRRVRRAAQRASAVLVANSASQKKFTHVTGVPTRIILETGIAQVADAPRVPRRGSGPLKILWSGQFVARKGLGLLLKALARLPKDFAFELHVVGGGTMERRWKRLASRLGLDSHVTWLGWIPYQEAQRQYAWGDVFVFTSLRDMFGNVNLEALANGLPVICLDHQGVHDVVTDECGIKVPVSTPRQVVDDLSAALVRFAGNRARAAAMSQAALDRAREYLWARQAERIKEVYHQVLAQDEPQNGRSPLDKSPLERSSNGSPKEEPRPPARRSVAVAAARHPASKAARRIAKRAAVSVGSGLNRMSTSRAGRRFGILMYHRIADAVPGIAPPTWNTPPADFRAQLTGLLERGFEAWPLARAIEEHRRGVVVPAGVFVVTFDDGYESVYRHAWPILKELNVPATVFLPTAYVDSPAAMPFDDWSGAGWQQAPAVAWRHLTTSQCREISADGLVELGAHTHTHQDFCGRPEEFAHDLALNVETLASRFGLRSASFAFPFGRATPRMMRIVRDAGLSCALTTVETLIDSRDAPFGWGRFAVEPWDNAATLAGRLNGWCDWATTLRNRLGTWVRPELVSG
jgi:glycosyltransferase involved in cell wall biosynthesis/peptidoglycan/xylan/chitin deacetylase (PgdA/CDA1 family)